MCVGQKGETDDTNFGSEIIRFGLNSQMVVCFSSEFKNTIVKK